MGKDNIYETPLKMENEIVKKPEPEVTEERSQNATKRKASTERTKTSRAITQILNGEFLTKEFVLNNLNFIFFVIFLLLLIVAKGYYGKQLIDDANKAQKELDEINADYVELIDKLESRGLKETVNPTKVIRIKKKTE